MNKNITFHVIKFVNIVSQMPRLAPKSYMGPCDHNDHSNITCCFTYIVDVYCSIFRLKSYFLALQIRLLTWLVHPTTYDPLNHVGVSRWPIHSNIWGPRGLPLGKISAISLSTPIQGVHLRKEAVVVEGPLILILFDLGLHVDLTSSKMIQHRNPRWWQHRTHLSFLAWTQ